MIIALDGPAGSGKSTLSRLIASELSFSFLDTGAMYRCITLMLISQALTFQDSHRLSLLLQDLDIKFDGQKVFLNGKDVTQAIRQAKVDRRVSEVAAIPSVRENLSELQRRIASKGDFVVEGRDMGSVVFPDAAYKFYIDASAEERARRRFYQIQGRGEVPESYESILREIRERDEKDRSRSVAPLVVPKGAVVIHTDGLNIQEVLSKILSYISKD